jgi:hypothetical protein
MANLPAKLLPRRPAQVRGYRVLEAANGRETGVSGLDPCGSALIKT